MNFLDVLQGILNALPSAVALGFLWGIMTLGVYLTFRILNIADMTCDGSFVLGGSVCAIMITSGYNPAVAFAASFGAGLVAGFVTGFLHTKLKMHELLAGILTMTGLYSINLQIMNGKANIPFRMRNPFDPTFMSYVKDWFSSDTFKLSNSTVSIIVGMVIALLLVVILYWFCGTEIGSSLRATGNNPHMVRAMGVDTDKMKILGLMISNSLIAMSGALVVQDQRYVDVTMGTGTLVQGLAAIVIGEAVFGFLGKKLPFWFTLLSVILGTILYRVVIAVVLQLGFPSRLMKLLTSIIITLILAIPVIKELIKKYNKKRGVN